MTESQRDLLITGRILPDAPYQPIEPHLWGVNHWLVVYALEARCVSYRGCIDIHQFRTDSSLHPHLLPSSAPQFVYATILKNGAEVQQHDDWLCLADAVLAGLFNYTPPQYPFSGRLGNPGRVMLTEFGWRLAHAVREHMSERSDLSTFDPAALGLI